MKEVFLTFATAGECCWKTPGLSGIVIVMLALGIGANSAVFSISQPLCCGHCPTTNPVNWCTKRVA
jgi:hypothetical protein